MRRIDPFLPLRPFHALPLLACLLAAGCAPLSAARSGAPGGVCEVREVSRDSLFVEGGRALCVFQEVLEPNTRGDVLLAGYISFLAERGRDGIWRQVARDSTFGAILPSGGEPVLVPAPIPTRLIAAPRAVARPDGTWAVVFAETHDYTGDSPPDSAARLWYGELDGARWTHLEPIPIPPGGRIMTSNAGPPVLRGDTLFWALMFRAPMYDVAVFSRRGGQWTHEIVPSFIAFYPRLAYSDTLGLVLATVGSGGSRTGGEHLFLWTRNPGWKPLVLLVPEEREKVMDPWISLEPGRELVAWAGVDATADSAWQEARAITGRMHPSSPVTVLDTAISGWGDFPVRPAGVRGESRF